MVLQTQKCGFNFFVLFLLMLLCARRQAAILFGETLFEYYLHLVIRQKFLGQLNRNAKEFTIF